MSASAEAVRGHEPVMVAEALAWLDCAPGKVVVDATLGCGGHARYILDAVMPGGLLIGIDRDPAMVKAAEAAFAAEGRSGYRFFAANYDRLGDVIVEAGVDGVDGVLLDLGFCTAQLADPARGFAYRVDGPLSMEMTPGEERSAEELVNDLDGDEIADIIYNYGEERHARRIARAIVAARAHGRITRTVQLAQIIERAMPRGPRRLHPARRTFQALRIAANRELDHLEALLATVDRCLRPGGRLVAISYHSLEDRLVKNVLRDGAREGRFELLMKKVVRPTAEEAARNPRARSAKLRAAARDGGRG